MASEINIEDKTNIPPMITHHASIELSKKNLLAVGMPINVNTINKAISTNAVNSKMDKRKTPINRRNAMKIFINKAAIFTKTFTIL